MRTSPSSGRSKPATIRNNVVLPLPEEPRMAVNEPGRNGQIHPAQDRLGPECLGDARDAEVLHADTIVLGASSALWPCGRHTRGLAVEPATEHVAGHGGDEHHDAGIGAAWLYDTFDW